MNRFTAGRPSHGRFVNRPIVGRPPHGLLKLNSIFYSWLILAISKTCSGAILQTSSEGETTVVSLCFIYRTIPYILYACSRLLKMLVTRPLVPRKLSKVEWKDKAKCHNIEDLSKACPRMDKSKFQPSDAALLKILKSIAKNIVTAVLLTTKL
ncbi:hypothetical protein BpHYR1_043231 [Brachionus plicatilis]|uniref:Uncharacterized protein n=1 Tax=Brachionus plicatilis TaxID=10195 RepID=A0A3M7QCA8_BRAPC|nr:hypothetical protein BpHYR1_043231 [Brachionus plicatilis]